MATSCQAVADRSCTACPAGQRTLGLNSAECKGCVAGYVRASDTCVECTDAYTSCTDGHYVRCTTSADGNGDYDCPFCEGQAEAGSASCNAGYGVSTRCDGEGMATVSCTACAAGTERPALTQLENYIQKCKQCATGYYKAAAGASACGACAASPANSVYAEWGTTLATSSDCPWKCNIGYYKTGAGRRVLQERTCEACPTGTYSDAVGVSACQACTNGPTNKYYLERNPVTTPTTSNACPWDCITGYKRNAQNECVQCEAGKFREASQNLVSESLTGSINQCFPCTSCAAKSAGVAGTYLTRACAHNLDTGCTECSSSCLTGQFKQYECNSTSNVVCQACTTVCPAGRYKSGQTCGGQLFEDEVLKACVLCRAANTCAEGYFLDFACSGSGDESNRCLPCNANKLCPTGQYRGGCTGYTDTTCVPYTSCAAGQYLSDESADKDGVCKPCSACTGLTTMRACTNLDDTVCQGSTCDGTLPCPLLTPSGRSAYFCNYDTVKDSTCGVCPPGYASNGQFCLECPRGFTCDRIGQVACRGQCGAGTQSGCDAQQGLGYATCTQECTLPSPSTRIPWRGSHLEAGAGDCATYFLCSSGFYKKFGTGGSISCEECKPSLLPTWGAWVTEGLSVGDDASCLWECRPELASASVSVPCVPKLGRESGGMQSAAGSWMGANGVGGVCGMGATSQARAAMTPGECLACEPLVRDVMRWKDRTDQCEFECLDALAVKRGSVCVSRRVVCHEEGLVGCAPLAYPWNRPGFYKTGWSAPEVTSFVVSSVVAYPRLATIGFGIKGRHSVTTSLGGTPRQVEGQLCSAATAILGGKVYVFGSLCNQSFLVYLDLSTPTSKGLTVLIGNGTRGWRDGFRTQALFESELYVATRAGSEGSVFVLDRWNCLLREVRVWASDPGDYRTRSYTLWGNTVKLVLVPPEPMCYGPGSLAWPRRFWPLRDDWLAFGDEDSLWQFNTRTRELQEMIREGLGQFEVDSLALVAVPDPYTLVLGFLDGVLWTVRAAQAACAQDTTSLAGGDCTAECYWKDSTGSSRRWVDQTTGLCRLCTAPVCGVSEEAVGCSPTRDAYCKLCELTPDPACATCADTGVCARCRFFSTEVFGESMVYTDINPSSRVIRFTSDDSVRFSDDVYADILVIGGGGNGNRYVGGAGGGAGTLIFAEGVLLAGGVVHAIRVGGATQPSSIGTSFIASGGGSGGKARLEYGGAGGGIGGTSTAFNVPGIWTSANVFANPGSAAQQKVTNRYYDGGAGGGAGGPGSSGTCGAGGAGLGSAIISGKLSVFSNVFGQAYSSVAVNGLVAMGGTGSFCCANSYCTNNGLGGYGASYLNNAGNGKANTGSGGGGAYHGAIGSGGSGLVLIKTVLTGSCTCLSMMNTVYTEPGTCDAGMRRPIPPCVAGWYLAPGGRHCEECPVFTATQYANATRFEQCKCVAGLARKGPDGACVGERLYDFEEGGACGSATSCAVPGNAQLVTGDNVACQWACNAGFYRDTAAGFDSQCRACLVGSGRTRGDDDQPWSCE